MIGKKKSETPNKDADNVVITTVDTLPGRMYEPVDIIVSGKHRHRIDEEFEALKKELRLKAVSLNADAVVGVRIATSENAPYSEVYGYGTAVRFINEEGDSE